MIASDLKYGLRQLRKSPGFSAVAVLILALGIGSATAVFSMINTLLLKGLPIQKPEDVLFINRGFGFSSYGNFENYRRNSQTLADVAALEETGRTLMTSESGHTEDVSIRTNSVSGNYFTFLGVKAQLGRTLLPDDDRTGAPRQVAVLSYALWQSAFAGDPAIVGKTILVDNLPLTVVGVADSKFSGMQLGRPVRLWTPLNLDLTFEPALVARFVAPRSSEHFWLFLFCRLKTGVSSSAARAELDVLLKRELDADHLTDYGRQIRLDPGGSGLVTDRSNISSLLFLLMAMVAGVLLVACTNVASLVLARMAARQKEFALRTALGSGRWRLVSQLITEGLVLAAISAPLAVLFAQWCTRILAGYLPNGMLEVHLDSHVMVFIIATCGLAGAILGLLPALKWGDMEIMSTLKAQAANLTGRAQWLGKTLVCVQIAVSVALLAEAGLFVRTLENLRNVDLGYNPSHLLFDYLMFDKKTEPSQRILVADKIQRSVADLPGIAGATFSLSGGDLMTGTGDSTDTFEVDGYARGKGEVAPELHDVYVGPQFLRTMGIPILRGTDLAPTDLFFDAKAPPAVFSAVVNQALAKKFFPGTDPIGHVLRLDWDTTGTDHGPKFLSFRIVGVAKDTREDSLRRDGGFEAYFPYRILMAEPGALLPHSMSLEVRTEGGAGAFASVIRHAVHATDANTKSMAVTTGDDNMARAMFQERMTAQLMSYFSGFAVILAALGLYGVLAFNVTRRTREIGVRMALGARAGNILSLVLREGLLLAAAGCLGGIIAAGMLAQLIASRLYGVPTLDLLNFLITAVILFAVAVLACWLPARRATKVDPMIALRSE